MVGHCITLFKKEQEEQNYKEFTFKAYSYIAQGVEVIVNSLAQDEVMTPFIDYVIDKPEDTRTADEIVDDVLKNCGFIGG